MADSFEIALLDWIRKQEAPPSVSEMCERFAVSGMNEAMVKATLRSLHLGEKVKPGPPRGFITTWQVKNETTNGSDHA